MPRGVLWVLAIALASALTVGLAVGATANAAYHAGTISVHVQPRGGGDIHVAVPAAAANLAIDEIRVGQGRPESLLGFQIESHRRGFEEEESRPCSVRQTPE